MKHRQIASLVLALGLVTLIASDAFAQEPGRRGGRPGGGPGGGPGMGGGDPTMQLLRSDEVRAELDVSEEQQAAIEKLSERLRERGAPGERPNFREMSDQERTQFIEEMRKRQTEMAKQAREQLEEVLLPAQMDRLGQIALQVQGVAALENDEVRETLKISSDQIAKLAEQREVMQATMREKMQEIFQSGDREAMRESFMKLRTEAEEKLLSVLTDEQKSQLEKLKGEPFDVASLQRGFGRGGRRGGPGDADGPGRRRGRPQSDNE